jgi:hypothetical protein
MLVVSGGILAIAVAIAVAAWRFGRPISAVVVVSIALLLVNVSNPQPRMYLTNGLVRDLMHAGDHSDATGIVKDRVGQAATGQAEIEEELTRRYGLRCGQSYAGPQVRPYRVCAQSFGGFPCMFGVGVDIYYTTAGSMERAVSRRYDACI